MNLKNLIIDIFLYYKIFLGCNPKLRNYIGDNSVNF